MQKRFNNNKNNKKANIIRTKNKNKKYKNGSRNFQRNTKPVQQFSKFQQVYSKFIFGLNPAEEKSYEVLYNDFAPFQKDMFKWSLVTSVLVEDIGKTCSICLDEFKAPRMTECGHVFCLPCLKKLFYYQKQAHLLKQQVVVSKFGFCPLCSKYVNEKDLKIVDFYKLNDRTQRVEELKPGLNVDFKLFEVKNHNIWMKAASSGGLSEQEPIGAVSFDDLAIGKCCNSQVNEAAVTPNATVYSKVFLETRKHEKEILQCNRNALSSLAFESPKALDFVGNFVLEEALSTLNMQLDVLSQLNMQHQTLRFTPKVQFQVDKRSFYSLELTRNIYLHPFNHTMLEKERDLQGIWMKYLKNVQIIEVTQYSNVDETFLLKYPMLQHVPLGARVTLVEVNLNRCLSRETIEFFKAEVLRRKKNRTKKKKKEKQFNQRTERIVKQEQERYRSMALPSTPVLTAEVRRFLSEGSGAYISNASSKATDNQVGSFASIVSKNGYFPTLGESNPKGSWGGKSAALKVAREDQFPKLVSLKSMKK
eukprot:snap_masked-scaffold_6-processed-gene-18.1-mRNA-1 protein AED:1.00 eAED:1.00 QI:0/-1/0/0/-1/1/1/0/532